MSFLSSSLLSVVAGEQLDADKIMVALRELAALQRTFMADFVGPAWLDGLDVQSTEALSGTVDVGIVAPVEPGQDAGGASALDLTIRSRQPVPRGIVLEPNTHHVVIAVPEAADETGVFISALPDRTPITDGAVALAWVPTDFERVTSPLDMRVLPWLGIVSKSASATIQSTTAYQDLTDARVAVVTRTGDSVLVEFATSVLNKAAYDQLTFPEVQFMLHDSTPESNYQPRAAFAEPKGICGSTSLTKQHLYWHGLYTPTRVGVHLLSMRARAYNADVSDAVISAMVLRADRLS